MNTSLFFLMAIGFAVIFTVIGFLIIWRVQQFVDLHFAHTGRPPLPVRKWIEEADPNDPFWFNRQASRRTSEVLKLLFTPQDDPKLEGPRLRLFWMLMFVVLLWIFLAVLVFLIMASPALLTRR